MAKAKEKSILIADDHALMRELLRNLLDAKMQANVVEADSYGSAITCLEAQIFDLVLLDYNMPDSLGLASVSKIVEHPSAKMVALLSGTSPKEVVHETIALGVKGYLPKSMTPKSLLSAIKFILDGEVFLPATFHDERISRKPSVLDCLTKREAEAVRRLSNGQTNREIAADLNLSEVTVKMHMRSAYAKLGVKNRTQAALLLRQDAGL